MNSDYKPLLSQIPSNDVAVGHLVTGHHTMSQEQVADWVRASHALQDTIDAISEMNSMGEFISRALRIAAKAFGCISAGFWEYESDIIYLRFWLVDDQVFCPQDLPGLDQNLYGLMSRMAEGFTVPIAHFGVPVNERTRPLVVHHATAVAAPEMHAFAQKMGWDWELNVPLVVGKWAEGAITLFRSGKESFSEQDIELAQALSKQIALAMKVNRIADHERRMAVLSERERATVARNADLERASQAMQETIDVVSGLKSLNEFIPEALRIAASAFEVNSAGFFEVVDNTMFLRYWLIGEQVYGPDELPKLQVSHYGLMAQLATGFKVPYDYLGVPVPQRLRAVCIDHSHDNSEPELHAFACAMGWTHEINAPLRVADASQGAITLYRPKEKPFSQSDVSLAESLAKQVALALQTSRVAERERVITVTRERLVELGKANEALRRSVDRVAEFGQVEQLVASFLTEAVATVGATGGAVMVRLPKTRFGYKPVAVWEDGRILSDEEIATDPYLGKFSELSEQNPGDIFSGINAGSTTSIYVANLVTVMPLAYTYHHDRGQGVVFHAPLRIRGEIQGFAALAMPDDQLPSQASQETVAVLATQVALALKLTELATEAQHGAIAYEREQAALQRTRDLTQANDALKRSIARLSENVDIGEFLGQVLIEVARQVNATSNSILLYDESSDTLGLRQYFSLQTGVVSPTTSAVEADALPVAIIARDIPFWTRVQRGWLVTHDPDDIEFCRRLHPSYPSEQHITVLAVPLLVGGKAIGFMATGFSCWLDIDAEQIEMVQALAHQATLALELTRLAGENQKTAALHAVLQERTRIAGEIHDSLAQSFTSIAMQSEVLARTVGLEPGVVNTLELVTRTARVGLAEARATVLSMRLLGNEFDDLELALEQLAERCTIQGVLQCRLLHTGPVSHLLPEQRNAVLRITQEAVTNALRHAKASSVLIRFEVLPTAVHLTVEDDGVGIQRQSSSRAKGFGLSSMTARAAAIGGTLKIGVGENGGTRVALEIARQAIVSNPQ